MLFLVAHKTCQLLHTVHCFGIHIWPNSENDCSVHLHSPVSTRCARAPKCADILECDFTRACFAVTDVSSSLSYLRHLSCTLSLASNCITSACFVQCVIFGFTVHVCCIFSTILSKLQAAEPRYRWYNTWYYRYRWKHFIQPPCFDSVSDNSHKWCSCTFQLTMFAFLHCSRV